MDIKLRGWSQREETDDHVVDITERLEVILTLKDVYEGSASYAL